MYNSLTDEEVRRALHFMERFGGGFASNLAVAWQHADNVNKIRLQMAFPELLQQYHNMANFKET